MCASAPSVSPSLPRWTQKALARLDDSQRDAAAADPNVCLLLQAGAGSGKTQTMAARIAFLIASGVPPSSILGICFTRKAAEELRSRVALTLQASPHALDAKALKLRTLHAFGLECLRRYEKIDDTTDVYDLSRQRKLAEEVVTAHARVARDADATERLVDYVNTAKTKKTLPPIEMNPANQEAYLFRFYQSMLHDERGAVDFGDLQQLFYQLLKPIKPPIQPEVAESDGRASGVGAEPGEPRLPTRPSPVCHSLRQRFTHIIVDEFQDLNEVQFEIVALMAGEACRVTCVGDPNQCIYGWRGAMPHIFEQWKRRFPQAQQCALGINYRSDPPIVGIANSLVRAVQAPFHARQNLDPVVITCTHQSEEYDAVPFLIEHFLRVRDPHLRYGDIAVLCRTRARAAQFVTALRDYGMPVVELKSIAGDGLSTVASLLAYFRLCVDPHRDDDVREVLMSAPHRLNPRVARAFMISLYATRDDLRRNRAWDVHLSGSQREAEHRAPPRYSLYAVLKQLVHHSFSLDQYPLMSKITKPTAAVLREFIAVLEGAHQLFDEFRYSFESRRAVPSITDLARVVSACVDFVTVKARYDSGEGAVQFVHDDRHPSGEGRKAKRKRPREGQEEMNQGDSATDHSSARGHATSVVLADAVAKSFSASSAAASTFAETTTDQEAQDMAAHTRPPKTLRDLLQSALEVICTNAEAVLAEPPSVAVKREEKGEDAVSAYAAVFDVDADCTVEKESDTAACTRATPHAASAWQAPVAPDSGVLRRPEQLLLTVLDEFTSLLPSDDFGPLQLPTVGGDTSSTAAAEAGGVSGMRAVAAVSVGTVHSAKGLEWPVVVLPGCNVGHFPLNKDEEERRVFYVGMSRAETQLLFVTAQRQSTPVDLRAPAGQTREEALLPSPYLTEIIRAKGQTEGNYADVAPKTKPMDACEGETPGDTALAGEEAAASSSSSYSTKSGGVQVFEYAELKRGHHQRQLEM